MSTKKRSLVIITCLKDKWKFEMLLRSMYAMLEPCDVVIVYNEGAKKYKEWLDWFLPLKETFLKNFSVRYFKAGDFIDKKDFDFIETSGWHSQQALKLLVYDQIFTDEYVILDSKNFFLKNCSIMDIVRSEPHGNWTLKGVTAYTEFMCKYLDMVYPGHHLKLRANVTPYIMQTKLVRRLVRRWKTHSKFYDWFIDTAKRPGHSAAEFILYELWELKMQQRIIDKRPTPNTYSNYATIWHHSLIGKPSAKQIGGWIRDQRNKGILVGGFHSGIHKQINLADIKTILKILEIDYILPQTADSPF
jgi:hypothetical protein